MVTFSTGYSLHSRYVGSHAEHANHVTLKRLGLTVQKGGGKERKLQAPEEPRGKNLQSVILV